MIETAPAHLTFADYIARALSESRNTIEWLAAKVGQENANILKAVLNKTMKAPVASIYPLAKALDLDHAHVLNVYLRDYLPELERAIFDCGGSMLVSEQERIILDGYRRFSKYADPELTLFEEEGAVVVAITRWFDRDK